MASFLWLHSRNYSSGCWHGECQPPDVGSSLAITLLSCQSQGRKGLFIWPDCSLMGSPLSENLIWLPPVAESLEMRGSVDFSAAGSEMPKTAYALKRPIWGKAICSLYCCLTTHRSWSMNSQPLASGSSSWEVRGHSPCWLPSQSVANLWEPGVGMHRWINQSLQVTESNLKVRCRVCYDRGTHKEIRGRRSSLCWEWLR